MISIQCLLNREIVGLPSVTCLLHLNRFLCFLPAPPPTMDVSPLRVSIVVGPALVVWFLV